MIILDSTTKSIIVKLGGAVTTTELAFTASWINKGASAVTPGSTHGLTSGTSEVTMIAAPASSEQREAVLITVFNQDTVAATVTVQLADGANRRTLVKKSVSVDTTIVLTSDQFDIFPKAVGSGGSLADGDYGDITVGGSGTTLTIDSMTSAALAGKITDETGTGVLVYSISPSLTTPILGTPTSGTLTNCTGLPVATGISGFGANVSTALATPSSANIAAACTDETGSGALVFATSPTLVTPLLGTPTSGTLTNCTGLPIATGVSGLAAGIATVLGTPSSANLASAITDETGSGALVFATSPTLVTPILGTPTSGTLTNCTGLPVSTGVSGLAAGVATFLATPSSANLRGAITDETGTGVAMFNDGCSATFANTGFKLYDIDANATMTVSLGSTDLTSNRSLSLETGDASRVVTISADAAIDSTLAALNGKSTTGSANIVLSTSPTLVTPVLGTPSSGTLSSCTTATQSSNDNSTKLASTSYVDTFAGLEIYPVVYSSGGLGVVLTNQALGAQFFGNTLANEDKHDVRHKVQARLVATVATGSASANTPKLRAMYNVAGLSATPVIGDYLTLGTSDISISMTTAGVIASSWINIAAGAKDDVFLCVEQSGGDAAADPRIGNISIQFKGYA